MGRGDWLALCVECAALDGGVYRDEPAAPKKNRGPDQNFQVVEKILVGIFLSNAVPAGLAAIRRRHAAAIGKIYSEMAVDKSRFPDEVLDFYRNNPMWSGRLTAMLNYYGAAWHFASGCVSSGELEVPNIDDLG